MKNIDDLIFYIYTLIKLILFKIIYRIWITLIETILYFVILKDVSNTSIRHWRAFRRFSLDLTKDMLLIKTFLETHLKNSTIQTATL